MRESQPTHVGGGLSGLLDTLESMRDSLFGTPDKAEEREAELAEMDAEDEGKRKARVRAEILLASKMPIGATDELGDAAYIRHTEAMLATAELLKGKLTIVVLSGPTGRGKTFAAMHCVWLRANAEKSSLWVSSHKLEGYARDKEQLGRAARSTPLLILDDLGGEALDRSGNTLSAIQSLITDRHEDGKRTLITTNLTPTQLRARYGDRVASRINGSGLITICDGVDFRAKG